jgi:hypothetical protein
MSNDDDTKLTSLFEFKRKYGTKGASLVLHNVANRVSVELGSLLHELADDLESILEQD